MVVKYSLSIIKPHNGFLYNIGLENIWRNYIDCNNYDVDRSGMLHNMLDE